METPTSVNQQGSGKRSVFSILSGAYKVSTMNRRAASCG
jgi:hypothetical protein